MIEKEKKLNSKNIYKGKIINLFVDDIETPNGVKSMREYVTHPGGVTILAFVDDKIILEKKKAKVAPGEMEVITLKEKMLNDIEQLSFSLEVL
jgi:ADP-ribose pyrophosphatase